ncbi:MAG: hypothetical protein IPK63_22085 [Candidatus Competibacteraceae bacterium]|nr:hypothetical protein [Candidatus Competibacteraceae bacterium]
MDEFFKGRIDEVRIYNRALSATEIKTDMTTPVANSAPPSPLLGNQAIGSKTDTISKGTAKAFQKQAAKPAKSPTCRCCGGWLTLVVAGYMRITTVAQAHC